MARTIYPFHCSVVFLDLAPQLSCWLKFYSSSKFSAHNYCLICLSPRMAFALYSMLFGIVVFCPETETAAARFLFTPPDSSYAVEGTNFTLEWTYTLDGIVLAAGFFNVTGTKDFVIGSRNGPGKIKSQQKYEARFRAQVKNTGAELTILEVQSSDEGTYKLSVVSSQPTFIWDSVRVIVHSPPSNIITSSDLNVTAPAQLTLNCSADGKPKPTITWTRVSDGTVVTMPLNITGGKKEESYQCTAYNGVGNRLTKVVKISLLFHPKVTAAQKVYVGHGQTALLTCEVEGNPTPIISWSPCHGKYVVCDKRYLNISKVQTARANYTCTATNALGVDSATTVLLIGGKNIYLRLSVSGESDNKDSVWETIEKEFPRVFANATHNYSGAELLNVSFTDNKCGSLNFDVVLKFTTEVAEDDTISIIQNAIVDGKIGELSYNSSCIIGIQTTVPLKDNKTVVIICAVLGIVACIALIGFIIWCVHKKKCCSEAKDKTDTQNTISLRKDKEQDVADEVAYVNTPMLPSPKIPMEETNQNEVQALPMYDKTKKTLNKGGAALGRPCDEQDAEDEHVKELCFTEKSSYKPMELPNGEYALAL